MPETSRRPTVPVEERLFSLVLALLATEQGLTKNEVLSSVQGYRQRYRAGGDNANLERQFERDKDDIRDLGVPLETVEAPGQEGNNQLLRYRIPRGAYELPADLSFTPEETTLLNLAAMVWREGSLSGESRRALIKLRSLGVESDDPVIGYAPRLRTREAAFAPLGVALERHVLVSFGYLKPGERTARIRTVAPLALVQHQGRWHLHGIDQDADGPRTFLLSRIVDRVRVTSRGFVPEGEDHAERALADLDRVWANGVGEVAVVPGSDAEIRLRRRRGTEELGDGRLRVHYSDTNLFADEVAGFGPEARVIAPPRLRDAVRARLAETVAAHGEDAS
ncbi:WYL domain-containing protein [Clavibacter michiganensis subsp. phaseoli]|uniref:WYL domain-containing protein n=1 Tax=Clavibacter phaseoli TaxID=1734031 RepID=A0A8I0VD99_9MICO|nr:WYL domain-containing protein [Clavibacter phaseoli]MBF4631755.1 WYL domain-containing protein [Clavibacter phaseoli]MCJ1711187.1 WYL domain-containing protein [Clavibacter phaseoli]RII94093.1 WYL domain-containing protein [Clavibacter michiganensis]